MSRTNKGSKGPGFDYWHREYNSEGKWAMTPGKFSKKKVKRRLRRKCKDVCRRELDDLY